MLQSYSFVLDAEALSATAHAQAVMTGWLKAVRQSDSLLYVSAVTLAEVTDGTARDANVRRALNAMRVLPVSAEIGYEAGRLRRSASGTRHKLRDLTVDAVVAATALTLVGAVIVLTSDPDDLSLLLQGTSVRVEGLRS